MAAIPSQTSPSFDFAFLVPANCMPYRTHGAPLSSSCTRGRLFIPQSSSFVGQGVRRVTPHRPAGFIPPRMQGTSNSGDGEFYDGDSDLGVDKFSSNGSSEEEEDAGSVTVEAEFREAEVDEMKVELYSLVSSVNRGFSVTPALRQRIHDVVYGLERTVAPDTETLLNRGLFSGGWRLVYTNSPDVLVLGLLSPLPFGVMPNQIYQNVEEDGDNFKLRNVIEVEPVLSTLFKGSNRTHATVVVSATGTPRDDGRSLTLTFNDVRLIPQTFLGRSVPHRLQKLLPLVKIGSPVGRFETTFVDKDVRIGRAALSKTSNVFVFVREP